MSFMSSTRDWITPRLLSHLISSKEDVIRRAFVAAKERMTCGAIEGKDARSPYPVATFSRQRLIKSGC